MTHLNTWQSGLGHGRRVELAVILRDGDLLLALAVLAVHSQDDVFRRLDSDGHDGV
jgi:hypothetical protein